MCYWNVIHSTPNSPKWLWSFKMMILRKGKESEEGEAKESPQRHPKSRSIWTVHHHWIGLDWVKRIEGTHAFGASSSFHTERDWICLEEAKISQSIWIEYKSIRISASYFVPACNNHHHPSIYTYISHWDWMSACVSFVCMMDPTQIPCHDDDDQRPQNLGIAKLCGKSMNIGSSQR